MCSDGSTTAAQYRTDENDARNWQSTTGKANAATPDTANAPPCQPYNPYKPPDARNEHTREKMPPQRPSQRHRRATRHDEQDDVHATTLPAYRYDDETPLCLLVDTTDRTCRTPRRIPLPAQRHADTGHTVRRADGGMNGGMKTKRAAPQNGNGSKNETITIRQLLAIGNGSRTIRQARKIKQPRTTVLILLPPHRNLSWDTISQRSRKSIKTIENINNPLLRGDRRDRKLD